MYFLYFVKELQLFFVNIYPTIHFWSCWGQVVTLLMCNGMLFDHLNSYRCFLYFNIVIQWRRPNKKVFLQNIDSGSEQEELHYRYQLTVIHGKSEYSYKGPVVSLVKSSNDIKNDGRCLVIRERVWDYMSYKLKITKHWRFFLTLKKTKAIDVHEGVGGI